MYPAGSNSVSKIQTSIAAVNSSSVLVPLLLHLQPSHVIGFRETMDCLQAKDEGMWTFL